MRKFLLFIAAILTCIYATAQTVIVQPVVCASITEAGAMAVSTAPVIVSGDESGFYQGGLVSFLPGLSGAGIDDIIADDKIKTPPYDGDKLDLSAYSGPKNIGIYCLDGRLLSSINTDLPVVDIDGLQLPDVFIVVINYESRRYAFKYLRTV